MKLLRFLNAANLFKEPSTSKILAISQIIFTSDFFKLISILRQVILPTVFFQQLFNMKQILTLPHFMQEDQDSIISRHVNTSNDSQKQKQIDDNKEINNTLLDLSFNSLIVQHTSNSSLLIRVLALRNSLIQSNLAGKYQVIAAYSLFRECKYSELLYLIPISNRLQPFTTLLLSKACMSTQNQLTAQNLCLQALKPNFQKDLMNLKKNDKNPFVMKKIWTTYQALLKCMSIFFKTNKLEEIKKILFPLLKQFFIQMSTIQNQELCIQFNINIRDGLLQLIKGWSKNQKRNESWECYQLAQQYISNIRQSHEVSLFNKKTSCLRSFIECQLGSNKVTKTQLQNRINLIFQAHYDDLDLSCYGSAIRMSTLSHNLKLSIKLFNQLTSRVQTAQLQNSNPLFDKSEKIIQNSEQRFHCIPMVQIAINQLLDTLTKKGKLDEALDLFDGISEILFKTEIYPTSTVPFNQILEALMKSGQVQKGWDFFEYKIYESSVKIDNFTLSALAKGITKECHAQNLDRLLKIIDHQFNQKHNESGEKIDIIVFNVIMLGCININQPERAIQVFKLLNFQQDYDLASVRRIKGFQDPQNLILHQNYTPVFNIMPDIISYNTLIKASLKSQLFNSAYSFYELLKHNKRVKANDVTYNTLIDGCTKTPNQMYLGWELLEEMCKNNIQPDSFTYSSLVKGIKKYVHNSHSLNRNQMNGLDSALKFLDSLLNLGIQNQGADQVLYNSLMDTCIHFKKFDKALELFIQMKERKIEPSSITYGILIKGFGQNRQINKAIQIYEQMSKKRLQPNQVTYGCLIDACVNNNKMNKAIQLFDSLQEASFSSPIKGANTIIYTTLIKGYTRQRDLNSALQLYRQMKQEAKPYCEPNNITFNSLIDCCVRVGNLNVAADIFNELQSHPKLKPDLITFSTMIKGYCMNGMIAAAFEMLDDMIAKYNIAPDEVLFNSLLDGCYRSDAYDIGNMVFERMRSANLLMTEISYSIMIKMYGKQAQIEKAFGLLRELKSKKMNAGVILYTCLIKACFQQKESQRAIQAFQILKQEGNVPDQVVYQTMIQGLMFAGKVKENEQYLWQAGVYVVEAYETYNLYIVQDLRNQLLDIIAADLEQNQSGNLRQLMQDIKRVGRMSNNSSSNYKSFKQDRQSINHVYHHHQRFANYGKHQNYQRGNRPKHHYINNSVNSNNNFQKKKYYKPTYVKKEQPSIALRQNYNSQEQEVKSVKVIAIKPSSQSGSSGVNAPLKRQDYQNVLIEKRRQNFQEISKKSNECELMNRKGQNCQENSQYYQDQQNICRDYSQNMLSSSGKCKYNKNYYSTSSKQGAKQNIMKFNQHSFTRL